MNTDFFTPDITKELDTQVPDKEISQRQGAGGAMLDYLSGSYVIRKLSTVFGVGGWSFEIGQPQFQMVGDTTLVTVVGKLTVGGTVHMDVGSAIIEKPSMAEMRVKDAGSDSIKRCARHFGDAFGLFLYDKKPAGGAARYPSQRTVPGGNTQGRPAAVAPDSGAKVPCEECGKTVEGYKSGDKSKYKGAFVSADQVIADGQRLLQKNLCVEHLRAALDAKQKAAA